MFTLGLALKIAFAGVGDEESSDGSVAIVGAEVTVAAIKTAEFAIGTAGFQNWSAGRRVSQLLRETKIFGFADGAEFMPVLLVMFLEFFLTAKAGAGGVEQQPKKQEADDCGYATGHQTIRSFWLRHAEPISRIVFENAFDAVEAIRRRLHKFDAF